MPRRRLELGTFHICIAHGLTVRPGTGTAPFEHVGGNAGLVCESQRYTVTVRREITRAELLAELAAQAGKDGKP